VARYLQVTSLPVRVAASVGLMLVIDAIISLVYGTTELRAVPVFLGTGLVIVDGIELPYAGLVTFGFAVWAPWRCRPSYAVPVAVSPCVRSSTTLTCSAWPGRPHVGTSAGLGHRLRVRRLLARYSRRSCSRSSRSRSPC
jgi:hypothetical protein